MPSRVNCRTRGGLAQHTLLIAMQPGTMQDEAVYADFERQYLLIFRRRPSKQG